MFISGTAAFPAAAGAAGMFIPPHQQPVHLQVLTGV